MKRFIRFSLILAVLLSASITCNAQSKNIEIDTIYVNNITIPTENGDTLIKLPFTHKIAITFYKNHTRAKIIQPSRMRYDVKEDSQTRLVLVSKTKRRYSGFIYDKRIKTARYFSAITEEEKEMLTKRFPFLKNAPTF